MPSWEEQIPLELEEFSEQIDMIGGYLHTVATEVSDFDQELSKARAHEEEIRAAVLDHSQAPRLDLVAVLALSTSLLSEEEEEKVEDNIADLAHRKGGEREEWDSLLPGTELVVRPRN